MLLALFAMSIVLPGSVSVLQYTKLKFGSGQRVNFEWPGSSTMSGIVPLTTPGMNNRPDPLGPAPDCLDQIQFSFEDDTLHS
jgi:hypothetical protein